jgi:hypothetical protein
VIAAAFLLPFLNKPFLIDDPYFLAMGRQIVHSPLRPMNFDVCWNIVPYCTKAYELTPGNTLMGYALVPVVLSGTHEWMAHAMQILFVWVAVLAMSSLILRLGWSGEYAILGTLLLVSIPPLLPMASTSMPDVLALAVGLLGMEQLAAWKQERRWYQGALAGLALGLSGIARAHLALLLPVGALFLADTVDPRVLLMRLRRSIRMWIPLFAAGVILLTFILATRERSLALNPPSLFSGFAHIRQNLYSYLGFLCFPLPLAGYWLAARWKAGGHFFISVALIAAVLIAALAERTQMSFIAMGACILADLLVRSWRSRDVRMLFALAWLLVPLPIIYYGHLPIKYLLPCMPAVILICFLLSARLPALAFRVLTAAVIIGGLTYSGLILKADAEFAAFGRDALTSLIRPHVSGAETVWYLNEFSSYWYARPAGAEVIVPGVREPKPGDLVAVGIREGGKALLDRYPKRTLIQTLSRTSRFGRTMGEGAGLYTNLTGDWLWKPHTTKNDRYELWRVE